MQADHQNSDCLGSSVSALCVYGMVQKVDRVPSRKKGLAAPADSGS